MSLRDMSASSIAAIIVGICIFIVGYCCWLGYYTYYDMAKVNVNKLYNEMNYYKSVGDELKGKLDRMEKIYGRYY